MLLATFWFALMNVFAKKVSHALDYCQEHEIKITHLVTAGGVASNSRIRETLDLCAAKKQVPFIALFFNFLSFSFCYFFSYCAAIFCTFFIFYSEVV